MIISRTPLRISFAGGGSDLSAYYSRRPGAVTSTAITKYMYVTVNKRFDDSIRVSYTHTEIVDNMDDLEHELVRESMKMTGVETGVEITTISDVPARTGLGSSSSLTVGLLNALYAYKGVYASPKRLAEEACRIEIDILKEPIGKQDQYIAAYGGLQHIRFNPDESVFVDPVICSPEVRRNLDENLLIFYLGMKSEGHDILRKQTKNTAQKLHVLDEMVGIAGKIKTTLSEGDLEEFGALLHRGWVLKRGLAEGITNTQIDKIYDKARACGALGGKVLGEGGGGFLLLYCPHGKQGNLRKVLGDLREYHFNFDAQGSKIIYIEDER